MQYKANLNSPCYLYKMASRIYKSGYFIVTGVLLFLSFAAIGIYVSVQSAQRTQAISNDMATKVYELKANIIRSEFSGFTSGLRQAGPLINRFTSEPDFRKNIPLAEILLLGHPAVKNGFIAVYGKSGDSLLTSITRNGTVFSHTPIRGYQLIKIQQQLKDSAATSEKGELTTVADSVHWLVTSIHRLEDMSYVVSGLDINLTMLQHYLQRIDSTGRAYAFVIDENGRYVTHPDEKLIGTKMPAPVHPQHRKRLNDSVTSFETVNSSYLQLPVVRFYTPLAISGLNWTLVVDTPVLAVDEETRDINRYTLILLVVTAVIILLLIAWAQTKWQQEFELRQQAELNRQEILAEKQELSLIAERQEKHNALLQLNTLKEKVNPHFLFNSLGSLNALIEQDAPLAQSFVMKLSKVYRYVLEPHANSLASVSEEIRFASEYFFLLKIRFGQSLAPLDIQVSAQHLALQIPFISIQSLIENAVKHNIVSKEQPLQIRIYSENNCIVVANPLQLRKEVKDSGKQGLNYLRSTYSYFGNTGFRCGEEENEFRCYLPVLLPVPHPFEKGN